MLRKDLLEALVTVQPGLATRDVIQQTTSFAFIDGNVQTYNDEISIKHPVTDLNIEGAIKAEELYKFLAKLKNDTVEVNISDNDSEVIFTSGRTKAGFTLQKEIVMPLDQIDQKGDWKKLPANFTEALEFAIPSCAKDMSRPVLTCINIQPNGNIESSDNYRITRYKTGKIPVKTFLLPATTATIISRYAVTQIAESKNWIHFKNEKGTEFSCRIFEDNFPAIDSLMTMEGIDIELPASIQEVMDRAAVFCTQDQILDQKVIIRIGDKRLKIRAEGEASWCEEEINMGYKGNVLNFTINPHLMKLILAQTRNCTFTDRTLKFTGENWTHVVSLII
jgi:DNA polymerase III sliding clamp (beta) subunit (PCNA family)